MDYIIIGKGYTSSLIKDLNSDIMILSENSLKKSSIRFEKNDKIYVPSESALEIVLQRSNDEKFIDAVMNLKDKHNFRKLMSKLYPDFYYQKINIDELGNLQLDRTKKYIVKPVKGFFGTAVKEIDGSTDLKQIADEIREELAKSTRYFSESILSKDELIVEQYISGDEYAVDFYFDTEGYPQILNIYHHPFPKKSEYFHVLYYTNESFYNNLLLELNTIFIELNSYMKISNFPIHAEFKLENNKLLPIEMNPLRYGGFGLADLTYHAFGINPFGAFFNSIKMDWKKIWNERQGYHYGWILGYNGTKICLEKTKPDHKKYQNYLGKTLEYIPINYRENPVFSLAYIKDKNLSNMMRILDTEFDEYFIEID